MYFTLTDEQAQMQSAAREFVENREAIEFARRQGDGENVVPEVWEELAEIDYTALTVPFDQGGLGDGILYLAIVLEELGRVALPGPFPETMAFAVPLIEDLGTDNQREEYLPAVAEGDRRFSVALYDDGDESLPAAITLDATREGDSFVLDGAKALVPYGAAVDSLVVAARTGDGDGYEGVSLFVVNTADPGVTAEQRSTLDATRPMSSVTFDGVRADLLGTLDEGGAPLRDALDRLNVAYCAMLVGGADRAVDLSAEHGREREQYGYPVGMYQAVKHRVADMWMDMQAARSLVYYAAWALANDEPDAGRAASAATAFCGDEMPRIFGDDVQNHGAMGFTTDHDAHLYLKQAKTWQQFLGSPRDHYDRIAAARGI